jgi:hypothetical protein
LIERQQFVITSGKYQEMLEKIHHAKNAEEKESKG